MGQIMNMYDFLELDEWFWAMFKPTPIWPNFDFGQLFMWIGANNDLIWLPRCLMNDFEQKFEPTPIWSDFTFGQLFIWIWVSNDQIWLPRAHMSEFEQCLKLTFGKFSVARKPIINGGAIRPGGLLYGANNE